MANEWKMVPYEPDREMLSRGSVACLGKLDHEAIAQLWQAMHNGSPVPPVSDVEVVVYACGPANQRRYIEPGNAFLGWHIDDATPLVDGAHVTRLTADVDRWHDICVERTAERDGLLAEVERLKTGPDHFCGGPMSVNPHAEAGIPGRYLEVGAVRECIPCLVKSRHEWANKANALQSELTKARELIALQIKVIEFATIIDKQAFAKGTQNVGVAAFRAMGDALSDLAHQSAPAAKACQQPQAHPARCGCEQE